MSISVFSCLTAFLWFNLALLLCAVLCRQNRMLLRFGFWPVALVLAAGLVRLLCPVTLSSTRVVHSTVILPSIQAALRWRLPLFGATLGTALLAVWIAGAAVNLFKLALELRQNRQALSRCVSFRDARIEAAARSALGEQAAACRFLLAPQAAVPLTVGFLRPVFLLPAYLTGFTDEEIRYVICHEWQHFRSRSNCWKLAAEILICLLWWNPPVYLLRPQLDQLLEWICDRAVVRGLGREEKAAYLETILKSLRAPQGRPVFSGRLAIPLSGSGKASELRQRFQMVAKNGPEHPGRIMLCAVCLLCCLLAASLLIVVQPFQMPAQEIFGEQKIVAFDAMPGSAYVKEDRNGRFVLHIFDIPCYTFDGVVYDLSALKVESRYIRLGENTDSQNFLCINYPNEGLIPTLCRTDTGELVPVHLPEGIGPSVRGRAFDKNECVKYYRYSGGGVLQQRIWSITYCRWLTEWEDAVGYF